MSLRHLSDDIILVTAAKEPLLCQKLMQVNEALISNNADSDVIIDFAQVGLITSASLSNLILLHKWLGEKNKRLILCNLAFVSKCIIRTAGLYDLFQVVTDLKNATAQLCP
ncbi:MAG: STAS domain-containing protein, partial [Planctomycetota bacterium]